MTEDDDDDDLPNEPGRIPDEAVREQYMFMGNLYTLTHIRTDADKTEPKVDVVSVPQQNCPVVEATTDAVVVDDGELGHKLNGSAVPDEADKPAGNGVAADGGGGGGGVGGGDSRPNSKTSKPSSRPASLILRSVFPAESVQE